MLDASMNESRVFLDQRSIYDRVREAEKTNSKTKSERKKTMYSPNFSELAAVSVRRLAWARQIPMTKAVDLLVGYLPVLFSPEAVCPQCKDKTRCQRCAFNTANKAEAAE